MRKKERKQEVRISNLETRIKELERWKRESMEKLRENEQGEQTNRGIL